MHYGKLVGYGALLVLVLPKTIIQSWETANEIHSALQKRDVQLAAEMKIETHRLVCLTGR